MSSSKSNEIKIPPYVQDQSDAQRKAYVHVLTERMMEAYKVSKKKDLAESLHCAPNTLSNWITQGTVPWPMIDRCHCDTGVPVDWLLYGKTSITYSIEQVNQLKALVSNILTNGVEYDVIAQQQPNGIATLTHKFEKELLKMFTHD
ncbi:MAG: hypothetical protein ACI9FJ_000637 [Alteromonadaceae bacterium]|jgi:hypothetical protein